MKPPVRRSGRLRGPVFELLPREEAGDGCLGGGAGEQGDDDEGEGGQTGDDGDGHHAEDEELVGTRGFGGDHVAVEQDAPGDGGDEDGGDGSCGGGAFPVNGSKDDGEEGGEAGEAPDAEVEDVGAVLEPHGEGISDGDDEEDEGAADEDLLGIRVGAFGDAQDDVGGEHGAETDELGVETGHDGSEHAGGDKAGEDGGMNEFIDHASEHHVGVLAGAEGAEEAGGPHADEDAGDPDDHDEDRVGDDGEAEAFGGAGGEPVLKKVGEHAYGKGDHAVGEKLQVAHVAFAGEAGAGEVAVDDHLGGGGESAEALADEVEGDDAAAHEDDGLKSVGPDGTAQAAEKDVEEDDEADEEAAPLSGETAIEGVGFAAAVGQDEVGDGKHFRKHAGGGTLKKFTRGDDANKKVGDDEKDEDGEEEIGEAWRFETFAEIFALGEVAVFFADGPESDADEKEDGAVDKAGPGGHHAIHANAGGIGFAGGANKGEAGHGGAEDGEEQEDGADIAADDEEVGAGAFGEAAADKAEGDEESEITEDDPEGDGHDGKDKG